MIALQTLGIHYEYHYAILPTALPSNFVLFKKNIFIQQKLYLESKNWKPTMKNYVFVYLTFHIL